MSELDHFLDLYTDPLDRLTDKGLSQTAAALRKVLGASALLLFDIKPDHIFCRHYHSEESVEKSKYEFDLPDNADDFWLLRQYVPSGGPEIKKDFPLDPFLPAIQFNWITAYSVYDRLGDRLGVIVSIFDQEPDDDLKQRANRLLPLLALEYKTLLLQEFRFDAVQLFGNAAEFAKLGYWYRNVTSERVVWSDETYVIFGEEPGSFHPTIEGYYKYLHPDDLERMQQAEIDSYSQDKKLSIDHRIITRNKEVRWVHLQGQIRRDENGEPEQFFGIVQDITDQKNRELELRESSRTDYLTGLVNRRGFIQALTSKIEECSGKCEFYVTYLDLDYFKEVNDIYGHDVGDRLLHLLGMRLENQIKQNEIIARIGGDEFAIIHEASLHIQSILNDIMDSITRAYEFDELRITLSASMGTAKFPKDAKESEKLMALADTAMFYAKKSGRNRHQFYDARLQASAERSANIRERLKRAVESSQGIFMEYQPIIERIGETPRYFEALVRWNDARLGQVSPAEFIPIAEESTLIESLSARIIERVFADIQRYRSKLPEDFAISINLSSRELLSDSGGMKKVMEMLDYDKELANHLVIEITETAFLERDPEIARVLELCRSLGIKVALDDFGTGFSSLTHCHQYPIDILKIDRTFVQDYDQNLASQNIVKSILFISQTLGLDVIAEGIESETVARILEGQVSGMQGFYFSKPTSLGDLIRYGSRPTADSRES